MKNSYQNLLTIAIQAGGKSKRMGRNKALLPFLGEPLIQRIYQRVKHLTDDVFIISNSKELAVGDLQDVNILPDILPGLGPLGGIYTSLLKAQNPMVALLACDMPFASSKLIEKEIALMKSENVDIVLPFTPAGLEPLHALYRKDTCLPVVEKAIHEGELKLISWFDSLKVKKILLEDESEIRAIVNMNSPQDLKQAEKLALETGI
ncbi:MAG: molybdenum cofactor guanylyltransferase [Anaerolineaceae bacterium]|nr:molybdenum cofactor guanylyltransferase [Anaerolineaceae bacterium]